MIYLATQSEGLTKFFRSTDGEVVASADFDFYADAYFIHPRVEGIKFPNSVREVRHLLDFLNALPA